MSSPAENDAPCSLSKRDERCELEENLDVLRTIKVFAEVPLPHLKLYAYLCKRACFEPAEFLFRQGTSDDRGFILLQGRAQVVREYQDHSIFLYELHQGEFFGAVALLSDINRLFSVKAITRVECLTLDRESFRKLLVQFPEVGVKVLDMMMKRIFYLEEKLLQKYALECVYH